MGNGNPADSLESFDVYELEPCRHKVPIEAHIREELVRRARDKHARQSIFSPTEPCDWCPHSVSHPLSSLPFTDGGAWNFIADTLEADHACNAIILDKPLGQTGYVLIIDGYPGCPKIYVKITMSRNKINGRSFHHSEF